MHQYPIAVAQDSTTAEEVFGLSFKSRTGLLGHPVGMAATAQLQKLLLLAKCTLVLAGLKKVLTGFLLKYSQDCFSLFCINGV